MEVLTSVFGSDLHQSLLVVLNLIMIESLLSVDNAVVLAAMVVDLPYRQRSKALKYGILGAYVLRGLSLVFASQLIQLLFLKAIGGLYLLFLTFKYFYSKSTEKEEDELLSKKDNRIYKFFIGVLGPFWTTVVLIEFMDLSFSIDNVFAAVAFTENIYLICIGVFIGILAMRFAAQGFVRLIEKFPFLEAVSFVVIGVLGVKLILSYVGDLYKGIPFLSFLNSHESDLYVSLATTAIFLLPILTSSLFNYPKRVANISKSEE
jgi:YkoY family integral membrane protein